MTTAGLTDRETRAYWMGRFDVDRDGGHIVAKERAVLDRWIAAKNRMHRPQAVLVCRTCGDLYHVDAEIAAGFPDCLAETCPSYRVDRDPLTLAALGEADLYIGEAVTGDE